jgi:hypothetical protein
MGRPDDQQAQPQINDDGGSLKMGPSDQNKQGGVNPQPNQGSAPTDSRMMDRF